MMAAPTTTRFKTSGNSALTPLTDKKRVVNPATDKLNNTAASASRASPMTTKLVPTKAASVAEERPAHTVQSAYYTVASRIASRVAEMAENLSIVERPKIEENQPAGIPGERQKRARKLEMRLEQGARAPVAFSAQFLDSTLQKMLHLQNRMLKTSAELSVARNVDEKLAREHAEQSADLSRIIALICAEKARQGA